MAHHQQIESIGPWSRVYNGMLEECWTNPIDMHSNSNREGPLCECPREKSASNRSVFHTGTSTVMLVLKVNTLTRYLVPRYAPKSSPSSRNNPPTGKAGVVCSKSTSDLRPRVCLLVSLGDRPSSALNAAQASGASSAKRVSSRFTRASNLATHL